MVKRAIFLQKSGKEPTLQEQKMFTGIYKQLLNVSVNELERLNDKVQGIAEPDLLWQE